MPFYRRPPKLDLPPPQFREEKSYTKWILATLGVLVFAWMIHHHLDQVPEPLPGVLVYEDPKIVLLQNKPPFVVRDYTVTPIASFSMRARVLSVSYYSSDPSSDLSPVDIAVGWGKMSDTTVINTMSITQGGRWYVWRWDNPPPVSDEYIASHSHNIHILPSTPAIAAMANDVRKNNIITLKGYLVSVVGKDGFAWTSGLSVDPTGANSCFVLWVENITIQ